MPFQTVGYVQERLTQKISEIDRDRRSAKFQKNWRMWLAYLLKAVAIFGGITVATGVEEKVAQGIGIAIAVSVGTDQLLSNSRTLVSFAEAVRAYDALRKRIEREHEIQLIPILTTAGRSADRAPKMLINLIENILRMANDELTKIETALSKREIETLRALEMENKGKTQ